MIQNAYIAYKGMKQHLNVIFSSFWRICLKHNPYESSTDADGNEGFDEVSFRVAYFEVFMESQTRLAKTRLLPVFYFPVLNLFLTPVPKHFVSDNFQIF